MSTNLAKKFTQFAEPVLGREKSLKILETCLNLERVDNIASFGALLAL